MDLRFELLLTVCLSLFGLCHVAPAATIGDAFPEGTDTSYTIINDVFLSNFKTQDQNVGYRLQGIVRQSTLWSKDNVRILKFELEALRFFSKKFDNSTKQFEEQTSAITKTLNKPFYAHWSSGKILNIYLNKDEIDSLANFKKGIVSLFQYQILDGNYMENDVSGFCDVAYTSNSPNSYIKFKTNCKTSDLDFFSRLNVPLGVKLDSLRLAKFVVSPEGTITSALSTENHKFSVNSFLNIGGNVESIMSLKLDTSSKTNSRSSVSEETIDKALATLTDVKGQSLLPVKQKDCIAEQCYNLVQLVKEYTEGLKDVNVGKQEAAVAFVRLITVARAATTDEFIKILNAHTSKEIKNQIYDLLGAVQTEESHEAAKKSLSFKSDRDVDHSERYFQALAVGTRPTKYIIADLLALSNENFDNEKVHDTFVQTLASMAQRFAKLIGHSYKDKIVEDVRMYLLKTLKECASDNCKQKYIRGLQNLQSPTTILTLLDYTKTGSYGVSVAAMKALRSFPIELWSKELKKNFENVFYQMNKKYDSSARALALDILLELKPNYEELQRMVYFLKSNEKSFEVKQFLLQKLKMVSDKCSKFRKNFTKIVESDPTLNNYHVIGQRGLSTALLREYSRKPSFNASLLSLQETSNGVLKSGIVDLKFEAENEESSVFTLGLYAGGMSSFVGGSEEVEPEEDTTATAGMELTVQGSYLRPLEFFYGQGQLMGHVWSGTASEKTPAYQASSLLQDHQQILFLHNGVSVDLRALGAMSIDLNGMVSLSLWNKNAHSEVEKNSGMALFGQVHLYASYISLATEFTVTQEISLNLVSDITFASDIALCMQLTQPDTILRQEIITRQKIPKTKINSKNTRTLSYKIAGFTHALNQKNNEMCNKIFAS